MDRISKDLVIGVIRSATNEAAKLIEQGKIVTGTQFEQILEKRNKYEHLYFWVERFTINSGRAEIGNPGVEITCTAQGDFFRVYFVVDNPPGKFNDQTPIAQRIQIDELDLD